MTRPSVALYCHNVYGMGHITRSLLIAAELAAADCECTIVTGCRALQAIKPLPRVRIIQLPAMILTDGFRPTACDRKVRGVDILHLRKKLLLNHLRTITPNVMLIDHNPLGLLGEMMPTLLSSMRERWATKFIWGIPYLDNCGVSSAMPMNPHIRQAMSHYKGAIAYVDPGYHALLDDAPRWALPARSAYMGFVSDDSYDLRSPQKAKVMALVCGGGAHVEQISRLLLRARAEIGATHIPIRAVIGPLSDPLIINNIFNEAINVELVRNESVACAITGACLCVARSGYNSASTLMRSQLPVVLVPVPGLDQEARAARLARLPGVWVVSENSPLSVMSSALRAALDTPLQNRAIAWSMNGASVASEWLLRCAREPDR